MQQSTAEFKWIDVGHEAICVSGRVARQTGYVRGGERVLSRTLNWIDMIQLITHTHTYRLHLTYDGYETCSSSLLKQTIGNVFFLCLCVLLELNRLDKRH